MTILQQATDLYLRGFPGDYIKTHTGLSIQSVLKQNLVKGTRFSKADVQNYQISFIEKRFNHDEVEAAYREMSCEFDDLYQAGRSKKIMALDCGFGDYAKVFRSILGESRYRVLRDECWKLKQIATVRERYGVDNVFDKSTFDRFVNEVAVERGREKRTATLVERYGVEHSNQDPDILLRMQNTLRATMNDRHGVDYPTQIPEVAEKVRKSRQETMTSLYGAPDSVLVPEIREKIFEARRLNGTLNDSKPEDALEVLLQNRFGMDDVLRNVVVDDRYPFHVDYYIKSRDMFIELNGDRSHNDHWFDSSDERDQSLVRFWMGRADELESEFGGQSRYRSFIRVWTETDVAKREAARINKLNYLVFWDGSSSIDGEGRHPRLSDARAWFDGGCLDSIDWDSRQTY